MARKMTVDDVDSFMRQLKWLIASALALLVVPLAIYVFYVERRIDEFEHTLQHSPPEELQANSVVRNDLYHLTANPVVGQVVYVPAYSHVYHGEGKPYLLTITLSVRNTSVKAKSSLRRCVTSTREARRSNRIWTSPCDFPLLEQLRF